MDLTPSRKRKSADQPLYATPQKTAASSSSSAVYEDSPMAKQTRDILAEIGVQVDDDHDDQDVSEEHILVALNKCLKAKTKEQLIDMSAFDVTRELMTEFPNGGNAVMQYRNLIREKLREYLAQLLKEQEKTKEPEKKEPSGPSPKRQKREIKEEEEDKNNNSNNKMEEASIIVVDVGKEVVKKPVSDEVVDTRHPREREEPVSSSLPLVFPKKLKSQAAFPVLTEFVGTQPNLTGDAGAVGKVSLPMPGSIRLDLKGDAYFGKLFPTNVTLCSITIKSKEATVDAVFNHFIKATHSHNVMNSMEGERKNQRDEP